MIILGPIVGHADVEGVRILFEADTDSKVSLHFCTIGTEFRIEVVPKVERPTAIHARLPVHVGSEFWTVSLKQDGDDVHHGSFSRGSVFTFISCNNYALGGGSIWSKLRDHVGSKVENRINVAIHMGDNICLDNGNSHMDLATLSARSKGYVGALNSIRSAYRMHWSRKEVAYVLANCSNLMIWDDHDICDSWDQDLKLPKDWISIVQDDEDGWEDLAEIIAGNEKNKERGYRIMAMIAAMQAYCEYQLSLSRGSGCIPGSWSMNVGLPSQHILFIDRRIHRAGNVPLIPCMNEKPDIIVATVPLFYLEPIITNKVVKWLMHHLAGIRDLHDHWLLDHQDMDQVLDLTQDGTILVSGDVHMCLATEIALDDPPREMIQITSSAISSPRVPRILPILLSLGAWKFKTHQYRGRVKHLFKTRSNGCFIHDFRKVVFEGLQHGRGFILD